MNEIARIEPAVSRAPMMAGGRVAAIVPQSMEDCYRLASAVCKAGMAPKGMETPEKVTVAMLHGLEVGLTPMAALQRIAVVNGRPTIWGDGAVGLVRGSGLCEYITETMDGAGDAMTATCEAKRRHEPSTVKRTFSVADAKKAGLWGKSGPWQQYPTRMLAMRARAFCLRDGFADVLGGLYLKEEIDDEPQRRAPTPPAQQEIAEAPAAAQIEHKQEAVAAPRRAPVPPSVRKPDAEPAPAKDSSTVERFAEAAKAAQSQEGLGAAWNEIVEPEYDRMMPDEQDELCRINRLRVAELPGDDDDGGEAGEP